MTSQIQSPSYILQLVTLVYIDVSARCQIGQFFKTNPVSVIVKTVTINNNLADFYEINSKKNFPFSWNFPIGC